MERFWKKVDRTGKCWIWTAAQNNRGYGVFGIKKRTVLAHRFAYELAYGEIPDGLLVRHKCDGFTKRRNFCRRTWPHGSVSVRHL